MWREPRNTRPSHPAIYATRVHWGHDPRDAGVPTFEAAVEKVIAIHSPTWKNPSRMAGQWRQTLRDYAHPRIGRKRVSEVATADVLAIVKPIWSSKPATARAVHQRIGAVMKWAVAKGYRPDNPAGDAIAAAQRQRHPASQGAPARRGSGGSGQGPRLGVPCRCPAGARVHGPDRDTLERGPGRGVG